MSLLYRIAADLTVVVHLACAAFIIIAQLLVMIGAFRDWQWIRNAWFRAIHLAMIGIVVAEGLLGLVCPLTTLEKWLRSQAGQITYQGDFLAVWVHDLLFVDFSAATLNAAYFAFGLVVTITFWLAPPRLRRDPADLNQHPIRRC